VWRGVFITIMLMVPGVNFVVPVLATAWMVHVFKDLDRKMTSESAVVS
jgi:uncharacterized protein involved in cysteine biosynthesis